MRAVEITYPFLAVYKKLVLAEMVFIYQQARIKISTAWSLIQGFAGIMTKHTYFVFF